MGIETKELTIQEKVGQMVIVGLNSADTTSIIDDLVLKYKVGGILLYRKNYNTYEELVNLINYIKKLNSVNKIPLFIAVDQEGGRVNRMPKDFENLPSAHKIANIEDEETFRKANEIIGKILNKTGINFNFAPVLDIKRFEDNHAIGDRAYSENKEKVAQCGIMSVEELKKQNILAVAKHFPGHGATKEDSHFILPIINKNISDIENEDMYPFEKVIEKGADAILISHLNIRKITGIYPTSMSETFIEEYLKKKYNFNGLVVTDDMRMHGITMLYGKNKPIKKAFKAGNDIIVFKYIKNDNIIEKIAREVVKGKISEEKINYSVNKILRMKEKYNVNNNEIEYDEKFVKEINEEILKIKNKGK